MNCQRCYPSEIARVGIVRSSESPVTKKVVGLSCSVTCHAILFVPTAVAEELACIG